jgi:hypothetical protein
MLLVFALTARGQGSFMIDGEEMLPQPLPPVSRDPLRMAGLPGELLRGAEIPGCVGGAWRHAGAATAPLLAVATLDSPTVRELQELRALLHALEQMVAEESADRVFVDMPVVRGPRGVYRDNIVRRAPRDIEAARERAAQSAAHALEKFMRAPKRRLLAARADGCFVSPQLPPGDHLLCGIVRFRDSRPRVGAALDLGVWWSPFTLGTNEQMRYTLDAVNAIRWQQIFVRQ